ncbi:FliM/FliN family flagellar motor C-terminal domain-containing protein [Stieleria sp. JC731]|uniref:FliM/FliN family flagellar motor switch protein n=1 Tax=Pirellulaceae TaxID=2691357 RepID=UPI001E45C4E2|nr:FliM/FliN family flagellar motor C-terminal domain-containing protein [Stieleria sp. JC731]MCC9602940.1 FliM/FliN family flagellar motor C-terminal domain-containing protein [Stieleria sp. JC731]
MSEGEQPNDDVDDEAQAAAEEGDAATATATEDDIPEFQQLEPNPPKGNGNLDLSRFGSVHVTLTAELGRTQLTIEELIALAEGSVIELNRAISAPVEIVAQGVPMGNGEVVVVDDQFAIRIKQIYSN